MQDILARINSEYSSLSKGQKKIADYIKKNYDKAAFMTAQKLSTASGTSESTVVRFAAVLGYEGYPQFQQKLQEMIRNKLTSLQRMEVAFSRIGSGDIVENVMNGDLENIKSTIDGIDKTAFDGAVNALIKARTIYVLGIRTSSALAGFLAFYLKLMFDNVKLMSASGTSEIYEEMLPLSGEDTMLIISYPRYSKRAVSAAEYACVKGCCVIALTDCEASPINKFATYSLTAKSEMAFFADSFAAPFSLAGALIVALGFKKKNTLYDNLEKLEKLWDEYQVYEKN